MRYGFVFPGGPARTAAEFAQAAEVAGWDAFFVWEPVWGIDAWVTLAAAAMLTSRIRLGTMITPLSRMRPWKLASETVTLDHLSGGRVTLAVGLGALDSGFEAFGEQSDRRTRAELLDEGLEILTGLWRGQPFEHQGKHYRVKPATFMPPPPPVQQPRIPIWVVGAWPWPKSMKRALRYDGLLPNHVLPEGGHGEIKPELLAEMKAYVDQHRQATTPFDIVMEGNTSGANRKDAAAKVRPWEDAGATWWLESMWDAPSLETVRERIDQGPPSPTPPPPRNLHPSPAR